MVAEARYRCNGKFGLRYVRGGFGTPFFGDDVQVRVAGDRLVVQEAGQARAAALTTLREAGEFVEVDPGTTAREHDSPELGDITALQRAVRRREPLRRRGRFPQRRLRPAQPLIAARRPWASMSRTRSNGWCCRASKALRSVRAPSMSPCCHRAKAR